MEVYNYTNVVHREHRYYEIMNTRISESGISSRVLALSCILYVPFTIIGIIWCILTNTFWYNPFLLLDTPTVGYFYVFFIGAPVILATILTTLKIQNYSLYNMIIMILTPKPTVDKHMKRVPLARQNIHNIIICISVPTIKNIK